MLSGLLKPTSGNIFINGENVVKDTMKAKRVIGLVPQDIALYPTLSAKENLNFWGKMYGLSGKLLKERVDEALKIVGLEDRKNETINKYSGGMKRRINIIRPNFIALHRPFPLRENRHYSCCKRCLPYSTMRSCNHYTRNFHESIPPLCRLTL
jgi:ABC-2 type transport system ATP-binding protein